MRPGPSARPIALALFLWLVLAGSAWAHAGNVGYSEVLVDGRDVTYVLEVPAYYLLKDLDPSGPPVERETLVQHEAELTRGAQAGLEVANGEDVAKAAVAVLDEERAAGLVSVLLRYHFERPVSDLRIRYTLFDPQQPSFQNLLKVHFQDETYEQALTPRRNAFRQLAGGLWEQIESFVLLGIEHILSGYDHMAFLVGMLIVGGGFARVLKIVTAFTAAHSLTLIASALGWVAMGGKPVEVAIALSIVYVGVENWRDRTSDRRWILAFAFGLVHGLGFAGALTELGLPTRGLVESLLAFNGGVEIGQLGIVLAIAPVVAWLSRQSWRIQAVRAISGVVALLGAVWAVQRLMGP